MNVAIGFDFDHTLGLDHGLERKAFGRLAARLGAPIDADDRARNVRIEALLVPFRRGDTPMETMIARFAATLAPHAAPLAAPDALAAMFREICYQLADELTEPVPGARATLEALHSLGIPVAILTNGWSPLQEKKIARALGSFAGPVLVSDVIGAYKPAPAAFAKLATALATPSEDVWYVGDNPLADVAGAQGAGMRAVWFDWEGVAYGDLAAPDKRITQLSELVDLVRGT